MADYDVFIRFKLDSRVCIIDPGKLFTWIFKQIDKRGDGFEYIEGWQDPELGGNPEDVVILEEAITSTPL